MLWFILAGLYLGLLFLRAIFAAAYVKRLGPPSSTLLDRAQLTLVQPILSGDPWLERQLKTNLQALPEQHFVWLIDEDDREAKRIAATLCDAHPDVAIRLVLSPPCPDTINPKIWKLQRCEGFVYTPFLAILDDDTTMPSSTAAVLVNAAEQHTVATGLPNYVDSSDWPSALLAQFVNNNAVLTYLSTAFITPPFTLNGMGYILKTEKLVMLDYFRPIQHELTDDLALATLILQKGGSIHQSAAPLNVQTGVRNGLHYFQLMHRWYLFSLLLLRRQSLALKGLIGVLHGLPSLLLLALVLLSLICVGTNAFLLFWLLLSFVVIRHVALQKIQQRFLGEFRTCYGLSLLSELMQPLHLVHAIFVRTIRWRKHVYVVRDTNDFQEK